MSNYWTFMYQTIARANVVIAGMERGKANVPVAADAAKKVIDGGQCGLNPNFGSLFTLAGQQANAGKEIMFEFLLPLDQANPTSFVALGQGSRSLAGQSGRFPLQTLVDKFECTDGKRIDQSPLYDPARPNRNRDLRMKFTVAVDGDTITATAPIRPKCGSWSGARRWLNWPTKVFACSTCAGGSRANWD